MENADIVIIGSGQGGVPLAVEFAGQGKRVVLFEKDRLGGSCINHGCTPSKAFLGAAHAAGRARQSDSLGIQCEVQVDFTKVMDRVRSVRDQFTEGVANRYHWRGRRTAGVYPYNLGRLPVALAPFDGAYQICLST
jgi:pyruvate/2-oxoglutarate dehydrogenase complex dihydrolipoamide dehydrogenase (E3) component